MLDAAFGESSLPPAQRSYHIEDIKRRLNIADTVLTAYMAGVNVFTSELNDLNTAPALFLPSNHRSRGTNPWANTRMAALVGLGDTVYALYHICAGGGRLLLNDECSAFLRNTSTLKAKRRGFIFCGSAFPEMMSELERTEETDTEGCMCFGEAYRRLPDVCLLTNDNTGAVQMRIMAQRDYRRRLTHIALKDSYEPPPQNFAECDAGFGGEPFFMAADMNLKGIDAAAERSPIVLAALPKQAENVLYARYRDTGKARVFALTESSLKELLGERAALYSPPNKQFLTKEGDTVDAPLIRIHRKTGKPSA